MQFKDKNEKMLGVATVKRQEIQKSFVFHSIHKRTLDLDGIHETIEGPSNQELVSVQPTYQFGTWAGLWVPKTRSLIDTSVFAYIRVRLINSRPDSQYLEKLYQFKEYANKVKSLSTMNILIFMHLDRNNKKAPTVGVIRFLYHVSKRMDIALGT